VGLIIVMVVEGLVERSDVRVIEQLGAFQYLASLLDDHGRDGDLEKPSRGLFLNLHGDIKHLGGRLVYQHLEVVETGGLGEISHIGASHQRHLDLGGEKLGRLGGFGHVVDDRLPVVDAAEGPERLIQSVLLETPHIVLNLMHPLDLVLTLPLLLYDGGRLAELALLFELLDVPRDLLEVLLLDIIGNPQSRLGGDFLLLR